MISSVLQGRSHDETKRKTKRKNVLTDVFQIDWCRYQ